MTTEFDVIVIGGGSTGENAAWYAIENGLTAALVEAELVGGECSYWACMPSKALLRPGEVLAHARKVPAAADAVTGSVDADQAFSSRDSFTSNWDDKYQVQWVESIGAELFRGIGRLAGERTVEVEQDDGEVVALTAKQAVVIATGTRASYPPVDGLDEIETWDNRDVTSAKEVPNRLLILGAGVVGAEMAQAYKRLGAEQVTLVELFDHVLAVEEDFVGELLEEAFQEEGIEVRLNAKTVKVERDGTDGPVTLHLEDGSTLVGDELLVATGRAPRVDDLGLETIGFEPDGYLDVDDRLRVEGVDGGWLFAIGDVNGRALLTHQGKYQARIVGDVLGGKDISAWADDRAVPRVVFTDPQVAAVGPTEEKARDRGIDVKTVEYELGSVAGGALLGKGVKGRAKLVIDQERRVLVGATFVGPGVGEMLHAATVAIVGEVPIDTLWHAVPAYPTVSEVWLRLLEADRGVS